MSESDSSSSDNERPAKKLRQAPGAGGGKSGSGLTSAPLDVAGQQQHSSEAPSQQPVIVLLDLATCETIKNKKGVYELLNCDDHRDLCKKKLKKDPNEFRPDILHQELLALLDSPLNKAGLLKVYVKTKKNVLIDINPATRIPRTYKRFAGLIVQLLHKMKIKAGTESTTLLKVIKNPFSQYLPAGTRCYGMSVKGKLYSPLALAAAKLPVTPTASPAPTCFIVGAMASGHIQLEDHPYIEEFISVSEYPLSGAGALSRIMTGIEHHWGIV